jgi:signal transduction histidine kinase
MGSRMRRKPLTKSLLWLVLSRFAIATVIVMGIFIKFFHQTVEDKLENYLYSIIKEREGWIEQLEEHNSRLPEQHRMSTVDFRKMQEAHYQTMEQLDEEIGDDLLYQFVIILVLILFSLIIILQFVSKKIWRPFNQTLTLLDNFSIDDLTKPQFPETKVKEFAHLNDSLKRMIDNTIAVFLSQKEFTENASHELHTPLALMQSQLDMLIQRPDLTEEQSEIISAIYTDISHLAKLNNNLLLLAKIENKNNQTFEKINISELTEDFLPHVVALMEEEEIEFSRNIRSSVILEANEVLYQSLLTNLLTNAIRYNGKNKQISLILTDEKMIISNSAVDNILHTENIFRRFNKDLKYPRVLD